MACFLFFLPFLGNVIEEEGLSNLAAEDILTYIYI